MRPGRVISTKVFDVDERWKPDHNRMAQSKLSGGDCFSDSVRQNSFRLEPRQLGEDAGLGSGG